MALFGNHAVNIFIIFTLASCRLSSVVPTETDNGSLKDTSTNANDSAIAPSPNIFSGDHQGIKWSAHFNMPTCRHEGHKADAWCTFEDVEQANIKNGVIPKLTEVIADPAIQNINLVYFSFSNRIIRKALCDAALQRPSLRIAIYLHKQQIDGADAGSVSELAGPNCNRNKNIEVIARGTEFGQGYLQHAKVFLATTAKNINPLSEQNNPNVNRDEKIFFTSSSANMSTSGTSIHFDNWLMFETNIENNLAQQNICFFKALREMGADAKARQRFAALNQICRSQIKSPASPDIQFMPVPHDNVLPKPFQAMRSMFDKLEPNGEVKVAIHRLTTKSISGLLADAKMKKNAQVRVIMDDDTFASGFDTYFPTLDVTDCDVKHYRDIRKAGVDVRFMETASTESGSHLFHSKFIVVDNKYLFQGAGNFTSTSLNQSGLGNLETFYYITVPEIVQAYTSGWEQYWSRATPPNEHPVIRDEKAVEKTINEANACNFGPSSN